MTDFDKVMHSPIVLDVEARENERIEAVLKEYDDLGNWRDDLAERFMEAEADYTLYPKLDEERADLNERAIEILDRLVTAVRRIWDGENRVIMPAYTRRLEDLVHEATKAVDPDDTDNREAAVGKPVEWREKDR